MGVSSLPRWPSRAEVDQAIRAWVAREVNHHQGLRCLGVFGSYASGDGVTGSNLDLVAVVEQSSEPYEQRTLSWDLNPLPVPSQLLILTVSEWHTFRREGGQFARTLAREVLWIHGLPPSP